MTGVINQRLNSQRTNLSKLVRKPIWPQTSSALHALDIIPGPGEMVVIEDRRIQLGDQQVRQNAVSQEKQSECVWRLRTSGDTVQRGAGGHGGFPEGSVMENPSANTGDTGHSGSVPESGRCPGGAWNMPWTESLAGYSPRGRKESDRTGRTDAHSIEAFLCGRTPFKLRPGW